jgi:hypothetical protein
MKNNVTYYIGRAGISVLNVEDKYIPFIREMMMMRHIRKEVFSDNDETLLKEIKKRNSAEAL